MCPKDWRFGDDNGGCCVAMTRLRNWRPRQMCWQRKIILRSWRQQWRRQLRNQKIQRVWVHVSDGGGSSVCLRAARGLDNDNGGDNWGSRRYNASDWTYTTAEGLTCLQAQGIDDEDGGISRVRRAHGLGNNDRGIVRGRGIRNASEGSETTTEEAGARQRAWWIYDNNGCGRPGRWAQRLQQQ